ncbi:hypothetical protein [Thaumasiovibrio sp. DFM-14]|uniref:hypothetical protein n=1 Tax=Thaumasiovibrio sp. DFM-14 TaxID=3384792 RepID=UPI0039A3C9D0
MIKAIVVLLFLLIGFNALQRLDISVQKKIFTVLGSIVALALAMFVVSELIR